MELKAEFAEPWELREVLEIYKEHRLAKLDGEQISFEHENVKTAVIGMIGLRGVIVMKLDGVMVGLICGFYIPCQFTVDVFFQTMLLYVKESARRFTRKFIELVMEVLKATVATKLVVGCAAFETQEKLERFWSIMGFKLLEKHLYKNIVRV